MPSPATDLKRTPLFETHVAAKARMVDFGGWNMPVQYSGIVEEHNAVRNSVGIFDVSHMGEIDIAGPEAQLLTDAVSCNDAAKLKVGQAQYSGLLNERGGFVDDILVHKVSATRFFLCVNASNQEKDFEHIRAHNRFDAEVEFSSARYAQIAIQGPKARATLQKLTPIDLGSIKYYWFVDGQVNGAHARIAHTGYTGEDGFEIYIDPERAADIWAALLDAGSEFGIKPCGLGARNTLRLEAKMALYGHELTADTNPFEADLAWIVKMDKGDFVGRDALEEALDGGIPRKLAGFEMQGRGIGRDGYEVRIDGEQAGWVTSGGPSPTLNKNIGLCYLPADHSAPGTNIQIAVRSAPVDAVVVPTPFYKRPKT
jgi:glycine cleavage system T protein (aminomethyltransferase)